MDYCRVAFALLLASAFVVNLVHCQNGNDNNNSNNGNGNGNNGNNGSDSEGNSSNGDDDNGSNGNGSEGSSSNEDDDDNLTLNTTLPDILSTTTASPDINTTLPDVSTTPLSDFISTMLPYVSTTLSDILTTTLTDVNTLLPEVTSTSVPPLITSTDDDSSSDSDSDSNSDEDDVNLPTLPNILDPLFPNISSWTLPPFPDVNFPPLFPCSNLVVISLANDSVSNIVVVFNGVVVPVFTDFVTVEDQEDGNRIVSFSVPSVVPTVNISIPTVDDPDLATFIGQFDGGLGKPIFQILNGVINSLV